MTTARAHLPQGQTPAHPSLVRATARVWAGIAAVMLLALGFAPGAAYAHPPRGHAFSGHFAAGGGPRGGHFGGGPRGGHFGGGPRGGHFGGGPRGGHFGGGSHWRAGGPAGGSHWVGRGGAIAWHAGPGGHGGGWHGRGGWQGGRRANWHGHWHGGGWHGGGWHAGWDGGDGWGEHPWRGGLWLGGYWGGSYWPPVDYGWNYPWFMTAVPYGAMTITFGGVPYYYVNHVYYTWSPYENGYVVTDPPPAAASPSTVVAPAPASGAASTGGVLSMRVTPLKGQSPQQTANDRYACDRWAVAQSGFNPISARQDAQASAQARNDYRRAFTACLQARGYSVQ